MYHHPPTNETWTYTDQRHYSDDIQHKRDVMEKILSQNGIANSERWRKRLTGDMGKSGKEDIPRLLTPSRMQKVPLKSILRASEMHCEEWRMRSNTELHSDNRIKSHQVPANERTKSDSDLGRSREMRPLQSCLHRDSEIKGF